jgi:hypothetical protein
MKFTKMYNEISLAVCANIVARENITFEVCYFHVFILAGIYFVTNIAFVVVVTFVLTLEK